MRLTHLLADTGLSGTDITPGRREDPSALTALQSMSAGLACIFTNTAVHQSYDTAHELRLVKVFSST